jgi:hypothetical protein
MHNYKPPQQTLHTLHDALLLPTTPIPIMSARRDEHAGGHGCAYTGGAYTVPNMRRHPNAILGKFHNASMQEGASLRDGTNAQDDVRIRLTDVVKILHPAIYLGLAPPRHYGHTLIEGLGRLWPMTNTAISRPRPVLAIYSHRPGTNCTVNSRPPNHPHLSPLKHPFFENANLSAAFDLEFYLINGPVQLPTLYVPSQLTALHRSIPTSMQPVYGRIAQHASTRASSQSRAGQSPPRCLYVSRRGSGTTVTRGLAVRNVRQVRNEADVEAIFQRHGFIVVRPGLFPASLEAELSLYRTATVVAGFEGSNLHNSAFMPPNGTVIMIETAGCFTQGSPCAGSSNQRSLADMNNALLLSIACRPLLPPNATMTVDMRRSHYLDRITSTQGVDLDRIEHQLERLITRWGHGWACAPP